MANAIYNDDPQAVAKLRERIAKLEGDQEKMRKGNIAVRGALRMGVKPDSEPEMIDYYLVQPFARIGVEISEARARELLKPDFAGRRGFPDYMLKNNNANIRRLKQRLAGIARDRDRDRDRPD